MAARWSSENVVVEFRDSQKPSTAVEYLAAHLSKIHGLDWHPDNENILATSSQDNSVRFWDYRQPRKYLNILACQVPVWKARYTPFSNGLVTVMVPQLRRENSLLLWDVCDLNTPVHTFVGHDDVVLEFQWRKQKEGSKDYQLVTWSRDQTLRMWRVDCQLQRLCSSDLLEGVEELIGGISLLPEADKALPVQESEAQQNFTHGEEEIFKEDSQKTFLVGKKLDQLGLPQTLQQEFSLINVQIRNVNMEMDAVNRNCTVSVHLSNHRVKMLVMFPAQYPNNAAPSFQFVNQTTIPSTMKAKFLPLQKSRRWKSKREGTEASSRPIKAAGKVIIQDISCLLPVHKSLGEMYILNVVDIQETCQKNAASALTVGRRDLLQVWSLATVATDLCLDPNVDPDLETPWAQHPFGRQLLESLLAHYCQLHDVQTLAMLCSVFETQSRPQGIPNPAGLAPQHPSSHSRYPSFTSSGSCSSMSDPGLSTSSWNTASKDMEHTIGWAESSPDDFRLGNLAYADPRDRERDQHDRNKRLLDPANTQQFDDFKKCYGEILYRWGLREKRAEVLKFVSCPPEPHKGIGRNPGKPLLEGSSGAWRGISSQSKSSRRQAVCQQSNLGLKKILSAHGLFMP
ncbi:GATOR complex protein WDR59 [Notechis scutatus]|uniref:GATOR complex protein WDR59 n=1 Tax=Notechis scutatus TaxID=8663 RepID=A0A6J1UY53_9SAUR|nr:GATOR complex protein WDR59 [Notechis scutatus]